MQKTIAHKKGFTLIELSIVLVIIGLIVGGVLVGRDLINAAAIRSQISQIEKFNTAVNTFYGKVRAWPGDMDTASAASFGLPAHLGAPGACGIFSNDGLIQGYTTWTGEGDCGQISGQGSYETGQFWTDLASPAGGQLIEGNFSGVNGSCASDINVSNVATCMPAAKIGSNNYINVLTGIGGNFYLLGALPATDTGDNELLGYPSLTVAEAYAIDKKMDDGFPTTGNVGYNLGYTTTHPMAPSATSCYDNGSVGGAQLQYSTTYNSASLNCNSSFKIKGGD